MHGYVKTMLTFGLGTVLLGLGAVYLSKLYRCFVSVCVTVIDITRVDTNFFFTMQPGTRSGSRI